MLNDWDYVLVFIVDRETDNSYDNSQCLADATHTQFSY